MNISFWNQLTRNIIALRQMRGEVMPNFIALRSQDHDFDFDDAAEVIDDDGGDRAREPAVGDDLIPRLPERFFKPAKERETLLHFVRWPRRRHILHLMELYLKAQADLNLAGAYLKFLEKKKMWRRVT
jgi:hypothetical protein